MLIRAEGVMANVEPRPAEEDAWIEVSLSATVEVPSLLEQVTAAMAEMGYPPRACREMQLVLEEAIVNGLKHGNGGDPTKRVHVRYRVGSEDVLADIEDEGPGFDPADVPDPTATENLERPCGRGLLLMRHYTSWVRYHGRGNRVSLCKGR